MRFGKKLALQVMVDQTGAPYLSHKPMKEAINRTVRELRLYQARAQGTERAWQEGAPHPNVDAEGQDLSELEERILALDRDFFALVDGDLARIRAHVREGEVRLLSQLGDLQSDLIQTGLLVDETQLGRLESVLPSLMGDKPALCRKIIELRMRSDPVAALEDQQKLATAYNAFVQAASQHAQYLEINVAGFRKLLKRHEKQIPQQFRSRPQPCLTFHKLVTRTSRQILDLTLQTRSILLDARRRFQQAVPADDAAYAIRLAGGCWTDLAEFSGLGPECEMVLQVQRQLKDPVNSEFGKTMTEAAAAAICGALYTKPSAQAGGEVSQQRAHGQAGQLQWDPAHIEGQLLQENAPHQSMGLPLVTFASSVPGSLGPQPMWCFTEEATDVEWTD
mmetsp:Transcript_111829/g.312638  ORF Transcript_111829/g.312638 Transcript_111829/m.312638 type:complete len:392 (+) Transcript_111829:96-1271(+)